jgi:hypothetical protein
VCHVEPFLLATRCEAAAFDAAVRRVTLFAFVLSAVVTALIAIGAVPRPMAIIVSVWVAGALGGRAFARRRRRQLGAALIDFEHGRIERFPLRGPRVDRTLDGATARTETSSDEEGPIWLVLQWPDGDRVRLCRGNVQEIDRVLVLLRRYKVPVDAAHE